MLAWHGHICQYVPHKTTIHDNSSTPHNAVAMYAQSCGSAFEATECTALLLADEGPLRERPSGAFCSLWAEVKGDVARILSRTLVCCTLPKKSMSLTSFKGLVKRSVLMPTLELIWGVIWW